MKNNSRETAFWKIICKSTFEARKTFSWSFLTHFSQSLLNAQRPTKTSSEWKFGHSVFFLGGGGKGRGRCGYVHFWSGTSAAFVWNDTRQNGMITSQCNFSSLETKIKELTPREMISRNWANNDHQNPFLTLNKL